MAKKSRALPRRVYQKHGAFWHVGIDKKWTRLCSVKEGEPAMLRALAALIDQPLARVMMPGLVQDWREIELKRYSLKTQTDYTRMADNISQAFFEFRVDQVRPSHIVQFLSQFASTPRQRNVYRSLMRLIFRHAVLIDLRQDNPVEHVPGARENKRDRYIRDSELRRIKAAALRGADGRRTATGPMIAVLIDLAYLTGQRVSDLLSLRWSDVTNRGIEFKPAKTVNSSGVKLSIGWTASLRHVIERAKVGPVQGMFVIHGPRGQQWRYPGVKSAWRRACERAGIKDAHFHDIRAKALTDVRRRLGEDAAQALGGHTTAEMTARYVKAREVQQANATR